MKNFEKYKAAKDRVIAFDTWCKCKTLGTCEGCELKDIHTECKNGMVCPLAWLDLEAVEEKPMPCPFCGGDCRIVHDAEEAFVQCGNDACMYSGGITITIDEAIAAHNRLCKAVASYKENN